MLKFLKLMQILMDEAGDGAQPNGGGGAAGGEGDKTDDFGYDDPSGEGDKGEGDKGEGDKGDKGEGDKGDDDKGKDDKKSATGYGDEDDDKGKGDDDKGKGDDDKGKGDDDKGKGDDDDKGKKSDVDSYEFKNIDGLLAKELEEIKSFAKKHGVNAEVAQALIDRKQEELDQMKELSEKAKQNQDDMRKEQHKKWKSELKEDKDFGGENYENNIKKADKVIEEYFPNLKNELTKHKDMLPPYVMRDLAKLSDHLFENETLVNGDGPAKGENDNKSKSVFEEANEFYDL